MSYNSHIAWVQKMTNLWLEEKRIQGHSQTINSERYFLVPKQQVNSIISGAGLPLWIGTGGCNHICTSQQSLNYQYNGVPYHVQWQRYSEWILDNDFNMNNSLITISRNTSEWSHQCESLMNHLKQSTLYPVLKHSWRKTTRHKQISFSMYFIVWLTLICDWISLALRRASTCMWLDTCLRVRVLPVRSLMYLAISSLRPANEKDEYIFV